MVELQPEGIGPKFDCVALALPDESGDLHHFTFTKDDWARIVGSLFDATVAAMGNR